MEIKAIFKKHGGFSLIKNLTRNGILLYAIYLFLVLPKRKKGLEILRELLDIKFHKKLEKKYANLIKEKYEILKNYKESEKDKVIWFCWLQGIENAPLLVKCCYESIKKICMDYKIIVITSENLKDYTNLPDFIVSKWEKGFISNTHFSDILRTNLLVENGGTWIDSTVLLTGKIPLDIENAPLFMFRTYKPGVDGKCIDVSSWFLSSCRKNRILLLVQELLFSYWEKHNWLCDYFLFHHFVQIALEVFSDESNIIPKYTNETPHFMLFELGKDFNEKRYNSILSQSFCHKLTYKLPAEQISKKMTFYKKLLELY